MESDPGTQKRLEAFAGVDVDFMLTILVAIMGILSLAVVDAFVLIRSWMLYSSVLPKLPAKKIIFPLFLPLFEQV